MFGIEGSIQTGTVDRSIYWTRGANARQRSQDGVPGGERVTKLTLVPFSTENGRCGWIPHDRHDGRDGPSSETGTDVTIHTLYVW